MKTSKYVDDNGLEIEYILQKSSAPSKALVVAFPGPDGGMRGGEWGYLLSIKKVADVNALFLKTDPEYSKSRLTFRGGKPVIDEAIVNLVNRIAGVMGIKQIISIGTSMGGWAALYFGLKYDWDIIGGSPDYTFYGRGEKDILYATGESGLAAKKFMDNLLLSVIEMAGKRGYHKKCFFSYGAGERIWKSVTEGPQMIKDMERNHINHQYVLYPFSDHLTCAELFPQTLEKYLKYYLGLSDKPSENDETLSPKVKMYKGIADAYEKVLRVIEQCNGVKPNLEIKNNVVYAYNNDELALRNYVYIKEGWRWSVGDAYKWAGGEIPKTPVKINKYFDQENISHDKTILSFFFQSTILSWYKRHPNDAVLKWLLLNFAEYINMLPNISEASFNYVHLKPFDHVIRMLYFIELHKLSKGYVDEAFERALSNEIINSMKYAAEQGANPIPVRWQYRMTLGLLTFAVYYKNSGVYELIYSAAMDIFNELSEYHFDKNGCCISDQIDLNDFLVGEIKSVMDFIIDNEMGKSKSFQRAKRNYNKMIDFASHICQPDKRLPALGYTCSNQWCNSRYLVEHSSSNFIRRTSNISILEDENSVSYITINGGSNVNSTHRHCDLLSFTWNYDGVQVFHDAGTVAGNNPLEEYVSSCVAHSCFMCDLQNYITPDYSDWTAIDEEIIEHDDYVIIPTSHTLIDGVILKRKFFWIKPNILILVDEGRADKYREFTQNYLLGDFKIDSSNLSKISIIISPDIEGKILQHCGNEDISLVEYHGVNRSESYMSPRGTIIENWINPRRGLNLAYTKKGDEAKFVTSIELHSNKNLDKEQYLQSINFDANDRMIVVLGDGKIIYEKQ